MPDPSEPGRPSGGAAVLSPRVVAVFGAQFLVVLLALLAVYPWIGPAFRTAVLVSAEPFVAGVSPGMRMERLEGGGLRYLYPSRKGEWSEAMSFERTGLMLNQLNLILLPALLLATPVPWRVRLRWLPLGLAALFVLQWLTMILWAPAARCLSRDPDHVLCHWAFYVLVAAGQLWAVALWGAFAWRFWVPGLSAPAAVASAGRNDPCPCGSGKKHKRCCGR